MQELSMNLLDIAQNSVAAGSKLTEITVLIDTARRSLVLRIADCGKGMSEETLRRVTDPFYTTRTTRKVGLGLPLFREAAETAGGKMTIRSKEGVGTTVEASFELGNIDLPPLGDVPGSIVNLVQCNPELDFVFRVESDGETFCMDTREIREILQGVPLSSPEVALFLREYLEEHTENLLKRSNLI